MPSALIGHTGFVGSNLAKQYAFDHHFNSKNSAEMRGQHYDLIVCAGVQAVKWWANKNPDEDRVLIRALLDNLSHVTADRFVLMSSVDVYPSPVQGDETRSLHPKEPYGAHRLMVEEWIKTRYAQHAILRLPGLFGDGLKKNVIFDLINRRQDQLDQANPASAFQYYCLDHLWTDILKMQSHGLSLLNLATEPVSTQEIMDHAFAGATAGSSSGAVGCYDFRSIHAALWGGNGGYLYSKEQVLASLTAWLQRQGGVRL